MGKPPALLRPRTQSRLRGVGTYRPPTPRPTRATQPWRSFVEADRRGHFRPSEGYPRGTYQTPWRDHGNAGHILIGAAIGFGIGAALGANQSAHNGTPVAGGVIVGGGLFGFLGGCVGKAVGDFQGLHYASVYRRRTYRPSWPEDQPEDRPEHDEQGDLRSHSKAKDHHSEASAKPASPGQPAGVEAVEP